MITEKQLKDNAKEMVGQVIIDKYGNIGIVKGVTETGFRVEMIFNNPFTNKTGMAS